ncbi:hypothetical protein AGMMS49975_27560 [Clostridia bacterium]|nr:hypothetical protein AGMMS49975_27560 [Clostridia bacterium]
MSKVTIKLNENYALFRNGYSTELDGELIILSGINGVGKSQFTDIVAGEAVSYGLNRGQNGSNKLVTKIKSMIKIDGDIIDPVFISKRTFKDNIFTSDIVRTEIKPFTDSKEKAWKIYKAPKQLNHTPSADEQIINSILQQHGYETPSRNSSRLSESDFKALLSEDFVLDSAYDSFTNNVFNAFQDFAAKRQDAKAKYAEKGGEPFNTIEYNKNAPWIKLNELFEKMNLGYRFKNDYEYKTPYLSEEVILYLRGGDEQESGIDVNQKRNFSNLSDGEKSIISLALAVMTEEKRKLKKIMIFDEFDNTLNPSLIETFFTIINDYFVKNGTR